MKKKFLTCVSLMLALSMVFGMSAFGSQTDDASDADPAIIEEDADDYDELSGDLPLDEIMTEATLNPNDVPTTANSFDIEAYEAKTFYYGIEDIVDSSGLYNGYKVYTAEDAAEYCIELIKDHKTKADSKFIVAVPYSVSEVGTGSPYAYAYNVYNAEFEKAFNNSLFDGGNGGDYLLYSMYGKPFYVSSSCKCFTNGDEGIALVYATPGTAVYYTSESEEKSFISKAASVVSDIKKSAGSSDYDKVCAVYDYICENVSYDYDNLSNSSYYTMYTAYGALCNGKAVCQGYANLFYYLCNELGVPCRIVAGEAFNGSTTGAHAWNIVKLDGTWYHVDSTWGASYSKWYSGRYFFLQSEQNFKNGFANTSHTMDYMTGLLYIDYTSSDFLNAYPISKTADYHNHEYKLVDKKDASCGVKGYEIYQCSGCGETYEDIIPAYSHEYEETARVEPDCTTAGYYDKTCVHCGNTVRTRIAAPGHSYEAVGSADASCVDYGYTDYVCSVCGHEYQGDIIASKGGHDYELTGSKAMTHTEDGYDEFTCTVCGDIYREIIPAEPECTWEKPVIINSSDTCHEDIMYTCSICGDTMIEESRLHIYEDVPAKEPTCTEDGNEAYSVCRFCNRIKGDGTGKLTPADFTIPATGHSGERLEQAEGNGCYRCSVCGELYHIEGEIISLEPATCTENGRKTYICSSCGMDVTRTLYATGHTWDSGTVTTPATETNCAVITFSCTVCGETKTEGGDEHSSAYYEALPATCVDEGCTEGERCSLCGMILWGMEATDPTGHTEGEPEYIAPTCTENGDTGIVHCSTCGEFLHEGTVITATGHDVVYEEGYPATCSGEGLTEKYYCDICGFVEEEAEAVPMTDHIIVSETVDPTCTEDGCYSGEYCEVCGEVLSDGYEIAAEGHSWVTELEAKRYTCTEDGNRALVRCENCGAIYEDCDGAVISAGHRLSHMEYKAPTKYEDGNIEFWYCTECDACFLDGEATQQIPFKDTVLTLEEDDDKNGKISLKGSGSGNSGTEASEGNEGSGSESAGLTGTTGYETVLSESSDQTGSDTTYTSATRTGDNRMMVIWIFAIICAVAVILIVIFIKGRGQNSKKS